MVMLEDSEKRSSVNNEWFITNSILNILFSRLDNDIIFYCIYRLEMLLIGFLKRDIKSTSMALWKMMGKIAF